MSVKLNIKVSVFGKSATLILEDNELKRCGKLTFDDGFLSLNDELEKLLNGAESPFDSLPQLSFGEFDVESFEKDTKESGLILLAKGKIEQTPFVVRFGMYSREVNGKIENAKSFSLQLEPFVIDSIPVTNATLTPPVKVELKEVGYADLDYSDEHGELIKKGIFIRGEMSAPGVDLNLVYPLPTPVKESNPEENDSAETALPTESTSPTKKGNVSWFDVNKDLGPAKIKQVGLQWKDGKIWTLLNANISLGGIKLSLLGFKAGLEIKYPPDIPSFGIDGIGIEFKNGSVELEGALVKSSTKLPGVTDQYAGEITVKFGNMLIYGMGAYAKINGQQSIFSYAYLGYPIGGPSFFFVEGLALGFGYNRGFIPPPINKVESFPLVAAAMGTKDLDTSDPLAALAEMDNYIPPMEGEMMLAVGIKFSTFEVIDSFLLLVVSFGKKLRFDLLGLSRMSMPSGPGSTPVVFIEIALQASYEPDKGAVKVNGSITNNSFVFSRDARITGGFAFYTWFKDIDTIKAGDFVLTMGGYHPSFNKPSHYPSVPRISINWQVDPTIVVKGSGYFAMTPRYGMAGFQLTATYHSGALRATFSVGADFLIQWKPFHYDITANVSIHASFTASIDLLFVTVSKTFNLDVGANVHIWGPQFGGHAHIHVKVLGIGFSFDVNFGAGATPPSPLTWAEFKEAFLPAKDIITITAVKGLIKTIETPDEKVWVFNSKELCFEINSIVPFSSLKIENPSPTNTPFAINPMQSKSGVHSSELEITISDGQSSHFKSELIHKQMPSALWGEYSTDLNAESLNKLVSGTRMSLAEQPEDGESKDIQDKNLEYDTDLMPLEHNFWSFSDTNVDPFNYDLEIFEHHLSTYDLMDFPSLNAAGLDIDSLQLEQGLLAKPKQVNLV